MRSSLTFVGCTLIGVTGVILLYSYDPSASGVYPPCLFHLATGLHCPGCGTGRALHHLAHGRVGQAFSMNVLSMVLLPVVAWEAVATNWTSSRRRLPRIFASYRSVYLLLFVVALFWIARNIPSPPFSYLAPGGWGAEDCGRESSVCTERHD